MRRVARTELAEQDLAAILDYLDDHSPAAADRLAAGIDSMCRLLAGQPGMGRPRDDLGARLRSVVVERYLLFFRVTDDAVTVVRIVHGARDLDAIDWDEG